MTCNHRLSKSQTPKCLKVDGNEKWEGSGRKQLFSYSLALWRLKVILNLNVQFCVNNPFPFPLATALLAGKAEIKCCS